MYVVGPFFGLYTRRNEIWWNPYCGCGENVVGLDAAFVAEVATVRVMLLTSYVASRAFLQLLLMLLQ